MTTPTPQADVKAMAWYVHPKDRTKVCIVSPPNRIIIDCGTAEYATLIAQAWTVPALRAALEGPDPMRSVIARLEALIAYYVTDVGPDYGEILVIQAQIEDIRAALVNGE